MVKNGRCDCCGQFVQWEKGIDYPLADSVLRDGAFINTLPEVMGIVTFADGAKVPCVLSRITEGFLSGVMGPDNRKVKPISFAY